MAIRTVFIDSSLANYDDIAAQYDATQFNVLRISDPQLGYQQIQDALSGGLSAAEINVVAGSGSLPGLFTPRVVFVDPGVADYAQLIAAVPADATVVLLDAARDGIAQIHDFLAANSGVVEAIDIITDIDSLDLVSHGTAGEITLGSTVLNSDTLANYTAALQEIGSYLSVDADILLYGCDVAADSNGQQFIEALATATGADVAASTDLTGSTAQGGDWVLEASTGAIETLAISDPAYADLLVSINNNTWNNALTVAEGNSVGQIVDSDVNINQWHPGASTALSVSVASANSGDQLTVKSTSGNSAISVSGTTVTYTAANGTATAIGTINTTNNGVNGAALTINLNANATTASVQLLAQSLQFANTSSNPPSGARAITLTLDDTDTGTISSANASVTIAPINSPPSGTNATITLLEDGSKTFAAADFGFSDSDGNSLAAVKITTLPSAGSLTLGGVTVTTGQLIPVASLGTLVFTPAANANGNGYASLSFQVQDNGGTANGGIDLDPSPNTLTFNVTPVNDAPSGSNATVSILEDHSKTFAAADFGFSDSDGHSLAAVKITTLPTAGSLTLGGIAVTTGQLIPVASLGSLVFTPAANANGTGYASFTFQVQDNGGTANSGVDLDPTANTLSIDVTAVNDAPEATPVDLGNVDEDHSLLITAAALLAGASDVDSSELTITALSLAEASQGSLSGNATDGWTFTPAANFNGSVGFNYTVSDGELTDSSTASLLVNPVNDAPEATAVDLGNVDEDHSLLITAAALLAGASDVDSSELTITALSLADPTQGSLSGNATDGWTFTPAANFNGSVGFNYTVSDGELTDSSTASLLVNPVNDAPTGSASAVLPSGSEDVAYVVSAATLLTGFSDIDGDTLSVSGLTASNGTVGFSSGNYTITPTANFNGPVSLSYNVIDGHGGSVAASQNYTLAAVNDAPTTSPVGLSTVENAAILIPLIQDYTSDPDAGSSVSLKTISSISYAWAGDPSTQSLINPVTKQPVSLSSLLGQGSISSDGKSLLISPAGELDWMSSNQKIVATLTYTVQDEFGATTSDTITLTIVGSTADKGKNLTGTNGADTMSGTSGEDVFQGGNGNDTLTGGTATDALYGGNGDDNISGGDGIDYLYGDSGNDTLNGDAGNDVLFGGKGNDLMNGGTGLDHFVFEPQLGADRITGFVKGEDVLHFIDFFSTPITASEFVSKYVTDIGNDLQINLPGGSIVLVGIADTSGLASSISFVLPA